jgi:uncharacterized protein (UPF0303 family)
MTTQIRSGPSMRRMLAVKEPEMNDDTIARLTKEDAELVFDSFDHHDAWNLGCAIRDAAITAGHPIVIDIRRPTGAILFHTCLPGATLDQQHWARRKAAVVFRFEASSALVQARMAASGVDPAAVGWFNPAEYAVTGGSVPVRVRGAGIIAAATVSGLLSDDDHKLVIDALRRSLT